MGVSPRQLGDGSVEPQGSEEHSKEAPSRLRGSCSRIQGTGRNRAWQEVKLIPGAEQVFPRARAGVQPELGQICPRSATPDLDLTHNGFEGVGMGDRLSTSGYLCTLSSQSASPGSYFQLSTLRPHLGALGCLFLSWLKVTKAGSTHT